MSTLAHEGTHYVDIKNGVIPKASRQTSRDVLIGEVRAHAAEIAFSKANDLKTTTLRLYGHLSPKDLAMEIRYLYQLDDIPIEDIDDILKAAGMGG